MTSSDKFKFLLEVKDVLDKAGITFWIDFGTLLGFYRDGDFLRGDPDMDIGIKRENQEKVVEVIDELKKIGKVITRVDKADKHYLAGYKIYRDDFWIDIAFFWDCNDKWILPISEWPKVMVFKKEYYTNLVDIEIKGVKFKMPEKIEEYLELHYGKDWRRPFEEGEEYDLHACPNVESITPYLKYLK